MRALVQYFAVGGAVEVLEEAAAEEAAAQGLGGGGPGGGQFQQQVNAVAAGPAGGGAAGTTPTSPGGGSPGGSAHGGGSPGRSTHGGAMGMGAKPHVLTQGGSASLNATGSGRRLTPGATHESNEYPSPSSVLKVRLQLRCGVGLGCTGLTGGTGLGWWSRMAQSPY
jgi:hypothetical protein